MRCSLYVVRLILRCNKNCVRFFPKIDFFNASSYKKEYASFDFRLFQVESKYLHVSQTFHSCFYWLGQLINSCARANARFKSFLVLLKKKRFLAISCIKKVVREKLFFKKRVLLRCMLKGDLSLGAIKIVYDFCRKSIFLTHFVKKKRLSAITCVKKVVEEKIFF